MVIYMSLMVAVRLRVHLNKIKSIHLRLAIVQGVFLKTLGKEHNHVYIIHVNLFSFWNHFRLIL